MALNTYEQTLATALEQHFGSQWFFKGAHPQDVQRYVVATTDVDRERALNSMKLDAVHHAHGCIHAALSAGLVKVAS